MKTYKPMFRNRRTLYWANNGIVTDQREVDDMETRRWAHENYFRLRGAYMNNDHGDADDANIEVRVILERIGSDALPRILEVRPNESAEERLQITGGNPSEKT